MIRFIQIASVLNVLLYTGFCICLTRLWNVSIRFVIAVLHYSHEHALELDVGVHDGVHEFHDEIHDVIHDGIENRDEIHDEIQDELDDRFH